ncbi:MAG: PEP-CTERM sorting domain-containing protein [Akkermansiaceae bacterium]|nr:PEP-CTERM sorting domain-containing protein [Akkermansiaceae bacterium]
MFSVAGQEEKLKETEILFTDGTTTKTGTIEVNGGAIKVTNSQTIPEPATATLSLLALAGLAARRRRAARR